MNFSIVRRIALGAAAGLMTLAQSATAATGVVVQQYEDPTGNSIGNFGETVAAYGTQPLVGAPDAADGGRVYLYDSGATHNPLRTFQPPAALVPRAFGRGLATLGTQILISDTAAQPVSGPSHYGAVAHYQSATDQSPIIIPNPGSGTGFGTALDFAPSGRFAVGDPYVTSASVTQVGRVYLYSGSNSSPELTIESPVMASQGRFGREIAFFDDAPVIPPPAETSYAGALAVGAPGQGRVYLFNQVSGQPLRSYENPLGGNGDFGAVVATAGTNLVIGAPNVTLNARTAAGVVFMFNRETGALVRSFQEPTATKNRYFGSDLAVIGTDYLVVGGRSIVGSPGKVYVFNLNTGALVGTSTSPHTDRTRFGSAVAAVGASILVGDPQGTAGAASGPAGQALLFSGPDSEATPPTAPSNLTAQNNGTDGILLQWVDNSAGEDGFTIERKRDDEAVFTTLTTVPTNTSQYTDKQGLLPDREYCYRVKAFNTDGSSDYSNTACVTTPAEDQVALIGEVPNPGSAGDLFGYSIAKMSAAKQTGFVIGAPGANDSGTTDAGRAYVYYPPSLQPALVLEHPNPAATAESDYFGHSVAAIGESVLVGAPSIETDGTETNYTGNGGRVYMFDAATGQLQRTFVSPEPLAGERFGYSVSAMGKNDVVVGAPGSGAGTGKSYVFSLKTGAVQTITNPSPVAGDNFGHAVAGGKGKLGVVSLNGACADGEADLFTKKGVNYLRPQNAFSISDAKGKFLIGAPMHLNCAGAESGYAYLVAGKSVKMTFTSPNLGQEDGFGYAVGGGAKFVGVGAALYDEP